MLTIMSFVTKAALTFSVNSEKTSLWSYPVSENESKHEPGAVGRDVRGNLAQTPTFKLVNWPVCTLRKKEKHSTLMCNEIIVFN